MTHTGGAAPGSLEPEGHVNAAHAGLVYTGEMVRAASWHPVLAAPLTGATYFRVVFCAAPSQVRPEQLTDGRIAVCVPGPVSPAVGQAEAERRLLREARASYGAGADAAADLDARIDRLAQEADAGWAAAYGSGRVVTDAGELPTGAVFSDGGLSTWAGRLGGLLLAWAYPTLPWDPARLPAPLLPERDAPLLWAALRGEPDEAGRAVLASAGTALGLSRAQPGAGAPLALVAEEASRDPGPGLGMRLAHGLGLTYPLAALLLLEHVATGEASLRLRPGHGFSLRDGTPLRGVRIGPAEARELAWPPRLWAFLEAVEPTGAPSPRPLSEEDDTPARLRAGVRPLRRDLEALATAQGSGLPPEVQRLLEGLEGVSAAAGPLEREARMREAFGDEAGWAAAAGRWRAWDANAGHLPELTDGLRYLDVASVPEERRELALEREALSARLHDPALALAPHQWGALRDGLRRFRQAYARAYLRHHDDYHARMGLLAQRMRETVTQARALARLNALAALGAPVAPDLPALAEELENSVLACGAVPLAEEIAQAGTCRSCGLHLDTEPPGREGETLSGYVRQALEEQNARLARRLARRLLREGGNSRLSRFVQVVQVADLSGLAAILDDELTAFIAQLLAEERPSGGS
jgi:hypothetical protein